MKSAIAHLIGDYVLQTDHMALEKTKRWAPALAHAATYTLPFLALTRSPARLAVIGGTHAVIDRYRLARHVNWAKNQAAPKEWRYPWSEGTGTGYRDSRPPWMTVWLMILTDNTIHLAINEMALNWRARD